MRSIYIDGLDETDVLMLRKLETVRQHFQQLDSEFRQFECCFIGRGISYGGYTINDRNDFEHLIAGDFIEYKKPIEYPKEYEGKKVYQMSDWTKSFDEQFKPGDLVNCEIAGYFLDVLPPRSYSSTFVQVGEPHDHRKNAKGEFKQTYATFKAVKGTINDIDSVWKYCGNCFANETEEYKEIA